MLFIVSSEKRKKNMNKLTQIKVINLHQINEITASETIQMIFRFFCFRIVSFR